MTRWREKDSPNPGRASAGNDLNSLPPVTRRDGMPQWDGTVTPEEQANYFASYSLLEHHLDLLKDKARVQAYFRAMRENEDSFAGKVVLEVGCGLGLLTILAARAGARKVYAVEATKAAAAFARRLVQSHGLENVVTVFETTVETLELPEQVDVIISEFMGHFLLRESMIDSVIFARDRFLKPGGAIFPSHCKMLLAPCSSQIQVDAKVEAYERALEDFEVVHSYVKETCKVDLVSLWESYEREVRSTVFGTSLGVEIDPPELLGSPVVVKEIDLHGATPQECVLVDQNFEIKVDRSASAEDLRRFNLWCGWFQVEFRGSAENPCAAVVEWDTGPYSERTHWGQEGFILEPPMDLSGADRVEGTLRMQRKEENWRLYDVEIERRATRGGRALGKQDVDAYSLS